jgi:hypothetical protein
MKRFITISLLALLALPALACVFEETHNYYLFNVYDDNHLWTSAYGETEKAWKEYVGSTDEYFYFNAEDVIAAARRKGDALMESYVTNLQAYLKVADDVRGDSWSWQYPSKQELAARDKTLSQLRLYAQGKLNTKMRDQHALLFMRCNMLLRRHQENVQFFERTASKYRFSPYQELMRNIYAGALLKTGRTKDAIRTFADQGDWNSLMTHYYKKRSCAAIRQEYLADPNSPALPFLLQDFVNNAQEGVDKGIDGKLFVRDITRIEALDMISLAAKAVKDGKTRNPAMWLSAKAWLEYMYGQRQQAYTDAKKAATLDDSDVNKDNARVIWLYIKAAMSVPDNLYDEYMAGELKWLNDQPESHYTLVTDRLVHQVLADQYTKAGRPQTALALLHFCKSSQYGEYLDTMHVDHLLGYLDYVKKPATNELDKYLKQLISTGDLNSMNDLIGTKYLRLCQWQQALEWLQKVPVPYYENKGYACYAALRKFDVEPWIKRQWLEAGLEWSDRKWHLQKNPKTAFAQEMIQLENELPSLSGMARQQRCYDLAVRYAQVNFTGDCWFIMRDGKSYYDTLRLNESDLAAKACDLLHQASLSSDFKLREKALFALAYVHNNKTPWYEDDWSTYPSVRRINRNSTQWKALAALADFERANASRTSYYVSRCDEYRQFLKKY